MKVIIGAGKTAYEGWKSTQENELDLLNRADFERMFAEEKPSAAFGPSGGIRTHGLLDPNQARYQTSPHPDNAHYYNELPSICQGAIMRRRGRA